MGKFVLAFAFLVSTALSGERSDTIRLSIVDGHLHNEGSKHATAGLSGIWFRGEQFGSYAMLDEDDRVITFCISINIPGPDWICMKVEDDGQSVTLIGFLTDSRNCDRLAGGDIDCMSFSSWDEMFHSDSDFTQCFWAMLRRSGVDVQAISEK